MHIASVIVDIRHSAVSQAFDYAVPDSLANFLKPGHRVEIPFGSRLLSGIVVGFKEKSDIEDLKTIRALLDTEPVFDEEALALSDKLAYEYAAPRSEYLYAMLPSGMRLTYEKQLRLVDRGRVNETLLTRFKTMKTIPFDASLSNCLDDLFAALENGGVQQVTRIRQKASPLTEEYVSFVKDGDVRGPKQIAILDVLKHSGTMKKNTLLETAAAGNASLTALRERGLVNIMSHEKYRELKHIRDIKDKHVILNDEQKTAYGAIVEKENEPEVFLLHGVASSGKTEVYIKLAERMLKKQRGFMLLVSEISLTPLLTARFKARFGDAVAVYHSRLSRGEQYDEWRRIRRKEAPIVIGARSAVFTPVPNLGMIVMDEEHSDTYIQDDHPRYHARDIAQWRAKRRSIPLVLGSATPSVDTFTQALDKKYTLLEMKKRALKSAEPIVEAIDMKEAFKQGNTSIFSEILQTRLSACLKRGEQALLLMNRRGTANFVMCRRCGHTIVCPECELPYTYHRFDHTLKCHHCGRSKPMPNACPTCASPHIRYMGIGSERVEQEVKRLFPDASVVRMDRDTTMKKGAHHTLLDAFETHGDILIGTQMIAKGLDFERVTLVAVLNADMGLYVPSFFAAEDTYALLAQMSGRSGRRQTQGRVVIQAYNNDHPVIADVIAGDYRRFYDREIAYRRQAGVPPFKNLLRASVLSVRPHFAFRTAAALAKHVRHALGDAVTVIGPVKPRLAKRGNRYRIDVLLKHDVALDPMPTIHAFTNAKTAPDTLIEINRHPKDL